jgi:hypothetical protein
MGVARGCNENRQVGRLEVYAKAGIPDFNLSPTFGSIAEIRLDENSETSTWCSS